MTGNKKKLLGLLGIGVASAASYFMLDLNGQPVDPNSVTIDPITFNGQTIAFPYSDDNTNENLIIKGFTESVHTWKDEPYYFAIKNISPNDQNVFTQLFLSGSERAVKIEEYKPHQAYQEDVPDYGTANLSCPGRDTWTDVSTKAGPAYKCGDQIRRCSTLTQGICKVDNTLTGTHKVTKYRDEWGTVTKSDKQDDFRAKDFKGLNEKFSYKQNDQFQYWIPSGQTKYFKATMSYPTRSKGEFYIKAFGSLGAYGSLDPSWYSASWGYRVPVTINYTKIGTTTTLSNFPFGFATTSAQFAYTGNGGHMGKTDGTDIVITDSDGTTKLSHEIESYNSSTGATIIHFKYTSTVSTSTNTTVYMYYGNSGASDQQDKTNVWDSNFKIVLHMNQPATATQTDSTINANNGVRTNTPVSETGQFGTALRFGLPGPSYLTASNLGALGDFTVCALYKASTTIPTYYRIVDEDYGNGFAFGRVTAEQTRLYVRNTGTNQLTLALGSYHYACGVRTSTNGYVWADLAKTTNVNVGSTALGTTDPLKIATSVNNVTGDYMNGPIDEFRISNTARSDAWLYTEYQYLMNQSSFYTWGAEESNTPAPSTTTTRRRIIID